MKIRPLHDRVVVKRVEEEQTTEGGLYIPDTAKEKPIQGDVIAVGDGKILDNGEKRLMAEWLIREVTVHRNREVVVTLTPPLPSLGFPCPSIAPRGIEPLFEE